ncbi:MAG: hypothetical protein K2X82_32050 [Gemmataceae bacterium]|nr:hypothetical protein [Gemmataceae bacterium]
MRRHLAASTLFAAGLVAMTASAQPPAGDKAPPQRLPEKKAPEKKADGVDAQIEAALATDPDIRMARAKIALAEAELAKARQGVALKVTTLRAGIEEQRTAAALAEVGLRDAEVRFATVNAGGSREQVLAARVKLEAAKATQARAEAELKLLVGDGPKVAAAPDQAATGPAAIAWYNARNSYDHAVIAALLASQLQRSGPAQACTVCHDVARDGNILEKNWHGCPGIVNEVARPAPAAPKGPVSDRLRAALDKSVSLGAKDAKVTFEQAVEAFKKEAGLDVPVRAEAKVGPVVSLGESLPVGAWLQLFADGTAGTRILVREYGLLVTTKELAPPDGVSVFDFWKQKPAGKKAKRAISFFIGNDAHSVTPEAVAAAGDAPFRAAAGLLRAGKPAQNREGQWEPWDGQNAVYLVIPDPRAVGLEDGEGVEIMVGLTAARTPDGTAWYRRGGEAGVTYKVTDCPPEAVKAVADALAKLVPVK